MGTQMANSIDKVLGREALKNSLMLGPVYFFNRYIDAYEQDSKQIRGIFQFRSEVEDKIIALMPLFPEDIFAKIIKLKKYRNDSTKLLSKLNQLSGKYKRDNRFFIFNLLSGQLLYESGYYRNALKYYKKSLDHLPDKIKTTKELGNLFFEKYAYSEALEMFNLYIQYSPDNSDAYESRGFLYYTVEEFYKAKDDYEKALIITPELQSAKDMLRKINGKLEDS
jgi:tetratricopeptide (TPR) repeat protein